MIPVDERVEITECFKPDLQWTETRWNPPREGHEHVWFEDEVNERTVCMASWCREQKRQ